MTIVLSIGVVFAVVAWLALTVLSHIERTRPWIRRVTDYDLCAAIPVWTFFAPNPGRTDLYLLYRDRDDEGNITVWRDIELERRASWWSLWNPRRRIGKSVVDVSSNLTANVDYQPRASVTKRKVVEFPYLLLLNYVCSKPADFRARMRQFAVARTEGHGTEGEAGVVFLSAFHRLS